jgi:hypothetical protein
VEVDHGLLILTLLLLTIKNAADLHRVKLLTFATAICVKYADPLKHTNLCRCTTQFYFFVYNKPEFRLLHFSNVIEAYKNKCIISHTKDTTAQPTNAFF